MNRIIFMISLKKLLVITIIIIAAVTVPLRTVYAATPTSTTLNGHTVMVDSQNKIVSWVSDQSLAYDQVTKLAWNYLETSVPTAEGGLPAYLTHSYMDPNTQQPAGWPHNPTGLYGMLIESALSYYQYSGDAAVLGVAKKVADYQLANGMTTSTDNWANLPYSSGESGSLTYHGAHYGDSTGVGDGYGYLEPDKAGELGYSLLNLFKVTGNTRYRDAAIAIADTLASHVRTGSVNQSPWPFRVEASTGTIREQYSADVIGPISLFDELIRLGLGNSSVYQTARTTAWNWMMTYPMQNNTWTQYFEDVPTQADYSSNINQYDAMMTARYLLLHPQFDSNWEAHVRGLITWVEQQFAQPVYGANTIREQNAFMHAMGSHTSRYADVNALLYTKTGDLTAKDKAYRAYNWATYMARSTGVIIDGPEVNNQWFTDGYGDYIRHFMIGMGAAPEWAPNGQNHLVNSGSTVTNVDYSVVNQITYKTFEGMGIDTLRLVASPSAVTANGATLVQRSDLAANGYTYNATTGVLQIRHDGATQITVVVSGVGTIETVKLTSPADGSTFVAPATINLSASASASTGQTITKVDFYNGSTLLGTTTSAPYTYIWNTVSAGQYTLTAKATDSSGVVTTSSPVSIQVNNNLPNPWQHGDIGAINVAGDASYNAGTFTVKGSGVDIWSTADSFHYVYQPLTGDGEIKARVVTQQNTDPWALAGIMVREDLSAGSRHALVAITPGNGYSFTNRTTSGTASNYTNGGNGSAPGWIRLVRQSDTLTGYKSTDGATWTQIGTVNLSSLAGQVFIGIAVTSHNNTILATDTFDNVTIITNTNPPVISNVTTSSSNQNGATITWNTDKLADSQVEYGTTTAYGSSTSLNTSLVTAHTQAITGLNAGTTYHYRVKSADAAGHLAVSGDYTVTIATPDTQPPTTPTNLAATAVSATQVKLAWTASTDNVAVTGYRIFRNNTQIATSTTNSYTDTTATANSTYSYVVSAYDAAGNVSPTSNTATVTTPQAPALAVDSQVITHQTSPNTTISSPALSTNGPNELLLAFISSDGPASAQSINGVSGGGLTWRLRQRTNGQAGTSEIWQAVASTKVSNIVVTATPSSSSYLGSMVVTSFIGANLTTDGAVSGANAITGAPSATITTTHAGSWIWATGNDWDNAITRTIGGGQTKVDEYLATGVGDTFWVQRQTNATTTSGTTVTINDTAPTTDRYNLSLIEILPAN